MRGLPSAAPLVQMSRREVTPAGPPFLPAVLDATTALTFSYIYGGGCGRYGFSGTRPTESHYGTCHKPTTNATEE